MTGVALAAIAMRLGAALVAASTSATAPTLATGEQARPARKDTALDEELTGVLASHAFTGRIAETLETKLRRRVDRRAASAIPSPSPSALTTTGSRGRVERVRAINDDPQWCSTPRSIQP
jgi:hypothetical protein